MITEEMIPRIEETFGFQLYDWQKDYLLGKINHRMGDRHSGKTFAYCLKLLLSDGTQIPKREIELRKLSDMPLLDNNYTIWFVKYLRDMNRILRNAGFETRLAE